MTQQTDTASNTQADTVAAADAAGGNFAKAFLPGLVLGLVLGLFIGAWLPPFFGEKNELIPAPPRDPQSEEERHRGEAPEADGEVLPVEPDGGIGTTPDPAPEPSPTP